MKGAKGFGRVFRRPRSPYWWISYPHRGREVRESSKSTVKQVAVDKLKARLAEVAQHTYVGPKAEHVTVADLLLDLQRHFAVRGLASLRILKGHIDAWKGSPIGAAKAIDVELPVLEECVQGWQREGYAPATISRFLGSLHQAYMLGKEGKKVATMPCFPRLAFQNAREGFFEKGDFHAVLSHLPDDGLRDFVEWAYWTGMRKGEIRKLTWAALNRETWMLTLPARSAKTRRPRRIPLVRELRAILERRLAARRAHPECAHIFARNGHPIVEFRQAWGTACRLAGVHGRLFHDLRRSGVRNLIRAGVPRSLAMKISGHTTESVFERYNIDTDKEIGDAFEKVSDYVAALPGESRVLPLRRAEGLGCQPSKGGNLGSLDILGNLEAVSE